MLREGPLSMFGEHNRSQSGIPQRYIARRRFFHLENTLLALEYPRTSRKEPP